MTEEQVAMPLYTYDYTDGDRIANAMRCDEINKVSCREESGTEIEKTMICCHHIFHFSTAACTRRPISIRACFLALEVMPSRASNAPGDVWRGSNSSI